MKKFLIIIFLFLSSLAFSNQLRENMDISNMPLADVVAILSSESGKNIITSQEAKNVIIDAYFEKGEDIDTVLYVLADAYNLSLDKNNGTTILSLKSENKQNNSKLIIKIINSENNEALENVKIQFRNFNNLQNLSNKEGFFIIDHIPKNIYLVKFSKDGFISKGEIINIDKSILSMNIVLEPINKEKFSKEIRKNSLGALSFYEINGKIIYTENFTLYNLMSNEMKKILLENFAENIKVSVVEKSNKIVVSAERDILENAKKIINELDKNPKQVRITSEILDISNNLFEELGFNWIYNQNAYEKDRTNTLSANVLTTASSVASGSVYGSSFSILRQFSSKKDVLNVGLNLLEATNDLIISSIPTLTISSGEEGEFKVTEEVVVGERRERNLRETNKDRKSDTIGNDENKNKSYRHYGYVSEPVFKEAGLILKVKPLVKENDEIIMDISIELSNFKFKKNLLNVGEVNSGTFNSEGGSKVGRSLSTKVKVRNGDTILLGGLKKSIKQNLESKIPILGDIPLINFFFKNMSKRDENSDMYIKLKVEIEE